MRRLAAGLLLLALVPPPVGAEKQLGYDEVAKLLSPEDPVRRKAARRLSKAGDDALVPGLVDAVFFTPRGRREELFSVLESLTGERHTAYRDWVEYVGRRRDLTPAPGYLEWKRGLFERIDPRYGEILYAGAAVRIRLEEVVSGGVRLDGIPSLDRPPTIAAVAASYLDDREKVFGVVLGGEARAYPLRFLSWHEMLNDEVGGVPVTLSYCTLCGSGILYEATLATGEPHTFGTSGLLYRSNKLMFDRQTLTLWSNLTGEPVVGRLAESGDRLEMLPMTLTTWADWRARHPDTRVLDFDRLRAEVGLRWGFDYAPGAADRARAGVSFPVWLESEALARDDEVYALERGGVAKAYPLTLVLEEGVVNDRLGDEPVVLVGDPAGGAVRAYLRQDRVFSPDDEPGVLRDQDGNRWRAADEGLTAVGDDGRLLDRIPGHVAFWFGWYAFHPATELYEGAVSPMGASGGSAARAGEGAAEAVV